MDKSIATKLVNVDPAPTEGFDSLCVPTYRGSTITYPDYASFAARGERPRASYSYGLAGTPTTRTLQSKLTELEGAEDTFLVSSGLMGITLSIMAVCEAGDTVLLPDNVYAPVRRFAAHALSRFGIFARYYDPANPGATLEEPVDRLRMIWVEAPGSVTMEIPDFSVVRAIADKHGALLGCDNSWASPILCSPIALGADIVVEALTKYLSGHSDVLMGSISVASEELAIKVHTCMRALGAGVSPDDCSLVLRGMASAVVRLQHVGDAALSLARMAADWPSVAEVLHPALPSFPSHAHWKRQFSGASGLFSIVLAEESERDFAARFETLRTFKIGASWGGTHSVLAPVVLDEERTVDRKYALRNILRVSVGLEDEASLREDLEMCLTRGR